jgi:hypothetical protein
VPGVDRVVEIVGRIIRQPNLALIVFPDQRFRRHVSAASNRVTISFTEYLFGSRSRRLHVR